MICSKLLIREKTWQCYHLRRKLGICISGMLFFFHELVYQFQFISRDKNKNKKSVVSQSLAIQAPCHFLMLCLLYQTLQIHKSSLIFCDVCYTLQLIFHLAVLMFFCRLVTLMQLSLRVHFSCCQRDFKSTLIYGSRVA